MKTMDNIIQNRTAWNKGRPWTLAERKKLSDASIHQKGSDRYNFKGESVSYNGLHKWLLREKGKPKGCENLNCKYPRLNAHGKVLNKPSRFEWAKIGEKYTRNPEDYISLCAHCHRKMDWGEKVKIANNS